MSEGRKDDTGKLRWGLLRRGCVHALEGVIKVLMFGAKKYGDDNWKDVADAERRYRDALDRHLADLDRGIEFDPDTGEDNWFHVATNALFVAELRAAKRAAEPVVKYQGLREFGRSNLGTLGTLLPPLACEQPAGNSTDMVNVRLRCGRESRGPIGMFAWGRLPKPEDEIINWKRV